MSKKNCLFFLLFLLILLIGPAAAQDSCWRDSVFPQAGNCGYDVQDYQLEMAWELEGDHWDVSEVITFISEWDTDELTFDFTDTYEITSLSINGIPAAFDRKTTKLTVHFNFAHDTEYKLYAAFNGKLLWGELFDQEGESRDPADGFCMLNEPTNAWRFYICNDHPKDKATYHYSFTVPASYVPAGSGRLLMIEEPTGTVILPGKAFSRSWDPEMTEGTLTFTYALEYQTVPYLFTVCAGTYDLKLQTLENGSVQLDFVDHNHNHVELAWELAAQQAEIISTMEEYFGPYPYQDLGAIFANTYYGAAIETLGRSLYDNATTEDYVVAHEITHQWMGDLISLKDWSDLWIKEGAATFGEALWDEHKGGQDAYEANILNLYEMIVNGYTVSRTVNETMIESLRAYNDHPADTLFDHDAAVRAIACFCQISRDQVVLKDGDVTFDEWGEGLAASCETMTYSVRTRDPFFEMLGCDPDRPIGDVYSGPKTVLTDDVEILYSVPAYYGGGIVYHVLRVRMGDDLFKEALQTLLEEYKWGVIGEEEFIEVFSRVAGEDLTDFIRSYLYYGDEVHIPDLLGIETWEETRAKYDR